MTAPSSRDLIAEGRRLRDAADLEQQTVAPHLPWPATVDWLVWSRNNAGVLLDCLDQSIENTRLACEWADACQGAAAELRNELDAALNEAARAGAGL